MSTPVIDLKSKIRGALLCSTIGDCFGAPFEYQSPKTEISEILAFLNGLEISAKLSHNQTERLHYTDDTALTREVARSLLAVGGYDPTDMARRLTEEFMRDHSPKRFYGESIPKVFRALQDSNYSDPYGPAAKQFSGSGSFGNGAAMRCGPLAAFCAHLPEQELIRMVCDSSRLTHAHHLGYNGAVLLALAIRQAFAVGNPEQDLNVGNFLQDLITKMELVENEIPEKDPQRHFYSSKLKEMKDLFTSITAINGGKFQGLGPDEICRKFGNEVSAQRSVPAAICIALVSCLGPAEDFPQTCSTNPLLRSIFMACAMGGDTDTIACMAAGLVGALCGDSIIQPPSLIRHCEDFAAVQELADQLAQRV